MVKSFLVSKTDNMLIQLFRYTFVGGIALVFDFLALFALTEYFGIYYLNSAAIAFMMGLAINYYLSVSWVFEKRTIKSKFYEFGIFLAIGLIGLGLNEIFIWFFTNKVNKHYLHSKLISAILVYIWNFTVRKIILF